MKSRILVLFVLFTAAGSLAAQELTEKYLFHQNRIREYLIFVPEGYDPVEPAPLLFVLHGLGADKENMLGLRMNQYAGDKGYIIVYPDAILSPLGTAWNSGTILNANIDDVGFINALIDTVSAMYNINERRIYSCGFSMGGIMSHRLGCESGDRFAAIASMSGPLANSVINNCTPQRKIPVLYIHGTADETLAYSGNGLYATSAAMTTFYTWGEDNDCGYEIVMDSVPDTANAEYHVDRYTYAGCDEAAEVVHYRIWGWPHRWPLSGWNINASVEMVNFFERHELPDESNIPLTAPVQEGATWLQAGPNPVGNTLRISPAPGEVIHWRIYDALGKVVHTGNGPESLTTTFWTPGLYLLVAESGSGATATIRLVK